MWQGWGASNVIPRLKMLFQPVETYTAPTPVVGYIAPAPAVTQAGHAPVDEPAVISGLILNSLHQCLPCPTQRRFLWWKTLLLRPPKPTLYKFLMTNTVLQRLP